MINELTACVWDTRLCKTESDFQMISSMLNILTTRSYKINHVMKWSFTKRGTMNMSAVLNMTKEYGPDECRH